MEQNGKTGEPDYRSLFVIGMGSIGIANIFVMTSIPAFIGLIAMGMVFVAISLANRSKWKK